jgi:hypothetical protein
MAGNMTLDLLPTFPEDPNKVITGFSCHPGTGTVKAHDNSIIMKLGDAIRLCEGVNEWNKKLIGQEI